MLCLISEATDQASIDAARVLVEEKLGGAGLNLLINNAGIMKVAGFKDVNADSMMEHYNVNCIGPLMVAKVGSHITGTFRLNSVILYNNFLISLRNRLGSAWRFHWTPKQRLFGKIRHLD